MLAMNARAEPAEPRRPHTPESLLRVAVAVFMERGYDGTSMGDIAAASGITKSSIYHHVRGKEELLRLALHRALNGLGAILAEAEQQPGDSAEQLERVLRRAVALLARERPYVTLLLRVHGNTATELWALEQRRAFDQSLAALIERAVAEGALRPQRDARLTTRLIFGLINSLTEWWQPDRAGPDWLADEVVALVFDGLRTRPSSDQQTAHNR